jgi:hypothetical protein
VCFFIDALDEHFGDHRTLMQILKEFISIADRNSHHIKPCLASRPENIFQAELANVPGFAVHKCTEGDIQQYVFQRMQPEIDRRDHDQLKDLAQDVVDKAQGVFLWVKLVMDELVEGACDGESVSDLRDLLSDVPSELEGLYRRAILRVRERQASKNLRAKHCYEAFVMFQVALCARNPYPLVDFMTVTSVLVSDTMYRNLELDSNRLPIPTEDMRRQLTARCGGLLETVTGAQYHRTGQKDVVQFIHQTAKEFVQNGEPRAILSGGLDSLPAESGHVLLLRYCVKVICKGFDIRVPDFLFHARNAEKATRQSQVDEINNLIDSHSTQALRNLQNLLMEIDLPKPFHRSLAGVHDPKMLLLLLAVHGRLKYYLTSEISKVKTDDAKLMATAVEEICRGESEDTDNGQLSGKSRQAVQIFALLLEAGVTANSSLDGQTLKERVDRIPNPDVRKECIALLSQYGELQGMTPYLPSFWRSVNVPEP